MINLPLVLHIGYHKTGTTFLQNNIFSKHPEIFYIGQPFENKIIQKAIREFKMEHDLDFDSNRIVSIISNELDKYPAEFFVDKKVIMISLESLHSGDEWFGRNIVTMSHRLKNTFPEAKIILGIRSQAKYIESNYKEYIIHGGKLNFNFFLYNSYLFNRCLYPKLNYDRVITLYRKLFDDNFYVYIYEKFFTNIDKELQKICHFIGIDEIQNHKNDRIYVGLTKFSTEIIRNMNKLISKDFSEQFYDVGDRTRLNLLEKSRRRVIQVVRIFDSVIRIVFKLRSSYLKSKHTKHIQYIFSESNKHLTQILDKDINKFGFWYK